MPASTAPSDAAFFDHEHRRTATATGRRRRPAPDWGGDDLFDHVPRRRFAREEGPVAADVAARAVAGLAPVPAPEAAASAPSLPPREPAYDPFPIINGRRTVTVTGHPDRIARPVRPSRPRTVEQRVHARPDQLAAWAVALGMLLIAMAVLTSG